MSDFETVTLTDGESITIGSVTSRTEYTIGAATDGEVSEV